MHEDEFVVVVVCPSFSKFLVHLNLFQGGRKKCVKIGDSQEIDFYCFINSPDSLSANQNRENSVTFIAHSSCWLFKRESRNLVVKYISQSDFKLEEVSEDFYRSHLGKGEMNKLKTRHVR